jgi:hypothetical protein
VVVLQQSTEPLPARDCVLPRLGTTAVEDEPVVQALVIPLAMVVRDGVLFQNSA